MMMDLFDSRSASPMLISQQMDAFNDDNYIFELKMDGFRCLCYSDDHVVDFRNKRNFAMLSKFPELNDINKNIRHRCILDGEIVVMKNGAPDFFELQRRTVLTDKFKIALEATRNPATFVAFDCLYDNQKELVWEPLESRKLSLSNIVADENQRFAVSRYIETFGQSLYYAAEEKKLEGVVAKRKSSIYHMGEKSKEWIKFKRMADEDFVIAGYIKKGEHIYSLIIAQYRKKSLIYKGHVTSGVTFNTIALLNPISISPITLYPAYKNTNAIWVKPEYVCTVKYMPREQNPGRHQAVFKGIKTDLKPEDCREPV